MYNEFPVIHSYTREQAISDRSLIDVSNLAREAGFQFPVAVTQRVWVDYIVPDAPSAENGQDTDGRLWDVLWMSSREILKRIRSRNADVSEVKFSVLFVMNGEEQRLVDLVSTISGGDDGEPVITISMPDED